MAHLSYSVAMGILKDIHRYIQHDYDALGITQQDLDTVMGEAAWTRAHIPLVMRTLMGLLYGQCEIMGVTKIVIPSEMVAPVVATFVAPVNRMLACIWLAQEKMTGRGAIEMSARGNANEIEPTTGDQLFALVAQLSDSDKTLSARLEAARKFGIALDEANYQGAMKQ
jgi:hypothetical protein